MDIDIPVTSMREFLNMTYQTVYAFRTVRNAYIPNREPSISTFLGQQMTVWTQLTILRQVDEVTHTEMYHLIYLLLCLFHILITRIFPCKDVSCR